MQTIFYKTSEKYNSLTHKQVLTVWVEHFEMPFHLQQVTWNVIMCLINNCKHLIANISSGSVPEWLSHLINSCVKYDKLGEVEYKKLIWCLWMQSN